MDNIKDTIRTYILRSVLPGESASNLTDDTPLRTSGILDSMATLNLVTFLEQTFGITIDAHETGIDNFDRIDDIAALVRASKQHGDESLRRTSATAPGAIPDRVAVVDPSGRSLTLRRTRRRARAAIAGYLRAQRRRARAIASASSRPRAPTSWRRCSAS